MDKQQVFIMAYTFKHGDRPVDGYTIQRAVGKGGFGEVYYAISDGGREVAIKYLRDNPQIELRGVSNCINLKSPYLVAIFDVRKTVDDEYAIILEYCSGPSLRDLLIAEPNGFEPQKAAFFIREIGKGLAYLHDRGIVHRDLKPGNIFYDDGYVKIGDYGLSKFISVSRHSGQTASVGTVHYMAPEIGSGNYSKGVDIYALGVMLYEMLLGKVPFEGSSLAEVLMKHLTAQPEVDDLPQPFGSVIRKALQKDPKDRYQSVDEMVEALLDVETVRDSLAGFSLKSLDGAVRYGGAVSADSPIPSPNPAPAGGFAQPPAGTHGQPPFALPIGKGDRLGKRVAKRMDRISHKLENKLAKLSGRRARKATPPPPPPPGAVQTQSAAATVPALARGDRRKRLVLSAVLSLGLAAGLGILVGNTHGENAGLAAGFLVVAMSAALLLAQRAIGWFGVSYGPDWAQHLISLAFCTPLLALGAAPLIDAGNEGVAVWLGLLVLAVFGNWFGSDNDESPGEVRFGAAMWKGLWALVFTAIAGSIVDGHRTGDFVMVSAGVAGAVSLIIQASAWWLAGKPGRAPQHFAPSPQPQSPNSAETMAPWGPFAAAKLASETAFAHASRRASDRFGSESAGYPAADVALRWGITRAFWGLVSFAAMGGSIFLCLYAATVGHESLAYADRTGVIIGCVACFAFMLFALRKVSPVRRDGFWRESLRPLLQSASLFGIGATITGISRAKGLPGEAFAGLITGLVMCSILLLVLTLFTGRKRQPQPFLQSGGSDYAAGGLTDVAAERGASPDGTPES